MEACEESAGERYGGILEDLEVLAIGRLANHLGMELFDSTTPQSFQYIDTALRVYQLKATDEIQCPTGLLLGSQQMCGDFSPALEIKCLLVGSIESVFYQFYSGCVTVGNHIDHTLEHIFGGLFLLLFSSRWRRRDFLRILLLFRILNDRLFLFLRLDKCADRVGKGKADNKHSITVKVVARSYHFLHLVTSSSIKIDVAGLEVLESVTWDHWDLVSCRLHTWLQKFY